jgi:hypothetical protein
LTNADITCHYIGRQMFVEALPFAKKAFAVAPWYMPGVGMYAGVLARLGQPEGAHEVLRTLGSGEAYGASGG